MHIAYGRASFELNANLLLNSHSCRQAFSDHGNDQNDSMPGRPPEVESDHTEKAVTRRAETNAEMGQKKVKCVRCSKTGHIAKNCPMIKRELPTHRVTTGKDEPADPWVLSVTADDSSATLSLQGPAYKAIVQVEGIRTRSLIDW